MIGINTTGLARGAGLTIPASTVNHVVDTLLEHGRIARPYLGVSMQPVALPDELRSKLNLTNESGLVMLSVEAESPASRAGITLGDVLVSLEGEPVADTDDVQRRNRSHRKARSGKRSVLRLRGGELREVDSDTGRTTWGKGK